MSKWMNVDEQIGLRCNCKVWEMAVAFTAFMQARQLPFDEALVSRSIAALRGGPAQM
jgi:hypothetical protein